MPLRLLRAARLDANLVHPDAHQAGAALAPLGKLLDRLVVARTAARARSSSTGGGGSSALMPAGLEAYTNLCPGAHCGLRAVRAALVRKHGIRSLRELKAAAAAAEAAAGRKDVKKRREALALEPRRHEWLRREELFCEFGQCEDCGEPKDSKK